VKLHDEHCVGRIIKGTLIKLDFLKIFRRTIMCKCGEMAGGGRGNGKESEKGREI
jgi:hypothetical protein